MYRITETNYLELIRNTGESLQYIDIVTSVPDMAVTDQLLTTIATKCSNLLSLKWNGSFRITDVGITALLNGCKKLHTVELKSLVIDIDFSSKSLWFRSNRNMEKHIEFLREYQSSVSTISTDVETMLTNAAKNVVIDLRDPKSPIFD